MVTIYLKACKQEPRHLPMVVGWTVDVVAGGFAVVHPGGSASEGCSMQFDAPTAKVMSSRAMSPV